MNRWLLLIVGTVLCGPVFADDPAGPGLDLIVIIDRSRSMARVPVDLMPAFAAGLIGHNAEANRVTHRFGVISFGSEARADLPLTAVGDPEVRRVLERSPPKTGGHTDALAAFSAAASLFRPLSRDPSRRRAIIVITDGVTYVPGRDHREYAEALRRFAAVSFSDTTIDVLLVRRNDAKANAVWRELSSNRVHEMAADRHNLLAELHRIVTPLIGTRATESQSAARVEVVLPPYLDFVVFDIFQGHDDIMVFPPGTQHPLDPKMNGINVIHLGDTLSSIVLNRPAPGTWTFRKSRPAADVRVFSQQFFARGMLITPANADSLRQHDSVSVAYRVVGHDGRPLAELPGYPISVDLDLRRPSGDRSTAPMTPRPDLGTSVFASTETTCDLPGRYWTEIRVTTKDTRGQQVEVFRDRWSGFAVAQATLIDCRLTSGPLQPLIWSRVVDTRLDCLDAEGHGSEIESRIVNAFRASLRRDGEPVAKDVTFHFIGRGSFGGAVRGTALPGSYTLRLSVDRSRLLDEPYNIRIVPSERTFDRTVSWPDALALLVLGTVSLGVLHVFRRTLNPPAAAPPETPR